MVAPIVAGGLAAYLAYQEMQGQGGPEYAGWLDPGSRGYDTRDLTPEQRAELGMSEWEQSRDPFTLGQEAQDEYAQRADLYRQKEILGYQDQQQANINRMADVAAGRTRSAAERQMQAGTSAALANQMAASASQRGGSVGAQNRMNQSQMANVGLRGAHQASQVRAQEQAAAQQGLGQAIASAQDARLAQEGVKNQMEQYYTNMGYNIDEANRMAEMDRMGMAQAQYLGQKGYEVQEKGAWIGAGSTIVGGAGDAYAQSGSDENFKKNVDKSGKALEGMLDKLVAATWDYKDQEKHGKGGHVGVIAQDLEKSELGKTMVIEGDDGKYVDLKKLTTAALAAAVHTHKRLKKLEGKK